MLIYQKNSKLMNFENSQEVLKIKEMLYNIMEISDEGVVRKLKILEDEILSCMVDLQEVAYREGVLDFLNTPK